MSDDWPRRGHRILVILAVLLFNFPLMAIADSMRACCGVGILPVYIFVSWAGLIVAAAMISIRRPRR